MPLWLQQLVSREKPYTEIDLNQIVRRSRPRFIEGKCQVK